MPGAKHAEADAAILAVERARLRLALLAGEEEHAAAIEKELQTVEKRLGGPEGRHRKRLAELFALSEAELDALDLCVAIAVEPALGAQIGALQGRPDRPLAGEVGLRLLFGHGPENVVRAVGAPLRWGLLIRVEFALGEPDAWYADSATVDYYFGRVTSGDLPIGQIRKVEPLAEWQVKDHARTVVRLLEGKRPIRVALRGREGSGRASLARCIADALGRQAVRIDAGLAAGAGGRRNYLLAQRMALLGEIALVWRGLPEEPPGNLPICALQFFALGPDESLAAHDSAVDIQIDMPPLSDKSLAALCKDYLPEIAGEVEGMLIRPLVGDLAAAGARGIADPAALATLLRQRHAARTRHVGRIEPAQYGWKDLVLGKQTMSLLESFADEARQRAQLLADPERKRIFGSAAHLSALFSGAPGLGKSMSANVIANDLGLDLLVVDTAALVSKYIGDTAKNLSEAFAIARETQCVLVFEEADGICGARVKQETSNDKHHNADTGHLLQLMEHHDGIVILSTNKRGNIDPAFMRRLRYIVEFRRPAELEAARMWDRMLAVAGMTEAARKGIPEKLAAAHDLTPAQIKGAAVSAAYGALARGGRIEAGDIEDGIRFEFQKEGRLVNAVPGAARQSRETGGG